MSGDVHDWSVLVAGLAHELRTPLTILKGRLRGLEDGIIDPATGECRRLLVQVDQLLRTIDEATTLMRALAGELVLDLRPVDLASVIAKAVSEVAQMLATARIAVECRASHVELRCDPVRLAQALAATLRLTAKRLPLDEKLTIDAGDDNGHVRMTVSGAALGFEHDEARLLAKPYWREVGLAAASQDGRIGATLAQAIVAAHGGSIRVEPYGDRPGSFLAFDFPACQ